MYKHIKDLWDDTCYLYDICTIFYIQGKGGLKLFKIRASIVTDCEMTAAIELCEMLEADEGDADRHKKDKDERKAWQEDHQMQDGKKNKHEISNLDQKMT